MPRVVPAHLGERASLLALLRQCVAGALAGGLVFLILAPMGAVSGFRGSDLFSGIDDKFLPGIVFGSLVTAVLALADELSLGSPRRLLRVALVAAVLGAITGAGYSVFGYALYSLFQPLAWVPPVGVLARASGWMMFGLGVGLSAGIITRSGRRAYQGLFGGILGGLLGGVLFETLALLGSEGSVPLACGWIFLGGAVGLFTALVEQWTKRAWLTFLSGAKEGRQVILHRDTVLLGRDELADIPLFGDANVGRQHAVLSLAPQPNVQEQAPVALMRVDGQPTRAASLQDGSIIEIGTHRMRFRQGGGFVPATTAPPPISRFLDSVISDQPLSAPAAHFSSGPQVAAMPPAVTAGGYTPAPGHAAGGGYAPGGGQLVLRVVAGPSSGAAVATLGDAVTVGREAGNTLTVADSTVSRRHAMVACEGGVWMLTDLGSSNGTYLNGAQVSRAGVVPGDRISLGDTLIQLEGHRGVSSSP